MEKSSNFETLEKNISQLETELQEFRQLFSMSLDLICIADINSSTFLKTNSAFQTVLGYSEEELIDKPFSDFIHPDDIKPTEEIIRDDTGYWNNLESYIEKHSDASFSHGMCQDCSEELYGNEDWYIEMKNKKRKE